VKIAEFLLRTLEANGVRHIFGNPGTTEIPLVRACEKRRKLKYVVALSEVAAVPMADGYARATRTFGVVNLHVAPGLGNGMGNLYTAGIAGTPLLVLIGGQDRRFLHTQPILWGPLEKMASTVCKSVFALNTRYDAAANVRRALRAALTPPYSPVALICPPDLLEQEIDAVPSAVSAPRLAALDAAQTKRLAAFLAAAKRPALIAAEDVHWSGAAQALQAVAHLIRAPVYVAPYTGVLPVASTAACYAGYLPPSMKQIGERLAAHDALFFVGGRGLRTTLYSESELTQRKAWLGHDASVTAPGGEFDIACVADPRGALREVARELQKRSSRSSGRKHSLRSQVELSPPQDRLHPTRAVHALLEQFGAALWVDESGLSTSDVRQWMKLAAGDYLINGSGGIRWGLAAAVGAAIGRPERPVVAVIGDGSALYASEALWTAAHHATKILLVILSNRRYATLNEAARRLTGGALTSFTIEPPVMDFGGLATLYGWDYAQASSAAQLDLFLGSTRRGITRNTLLDLKLDPALKPVTASRHF
jgi:benzoylformate decarboxylase